MVYTEPMNRRSHTMLSRRLLLVVLATILAAQGGCKGCAKKRSQLNPWARALPKTTASYGLPKEADAQITVNRARLLLSGKPLLKLKNGRLAATALRDGIDGLYVPRLAQALRPLARQRADGSVPHGRLAIHCQPAVPFRTLRAVLYTAMRAGFMRPWLVAEGAGGKRVGLPLELPSVPSHLSHGLRPSPTRTPALAIGFDGTGLHVTRWGRPDCPQGKQPGASGCASLGKGLSKESRNLLSAHLRDRYRTAAVRPGRRRPPSNAAMIWAGLDVIVGDFVKLLDTTREAPGGAGSCTLQPDPETHLWKRTSPVMDPKGTATRGCLYHQTVLVWSRPGHRKP